MLTSGFVKTLHLHAFALDATLALLYIRKANNLKISQNFSLILQINYKVQYLI